MAARFLTMAYKMHHPLRALLLSLILLVIYTTTACVATEVEIDTNGEQQQQQRSSAYPKPIHATFINSLRDTAVNLYWAGNANSLNEGSLQLYYGPLDPNGGEYYISILSDIIIYHVQTFASYIYITLLPRPSTLLSQDNVQLMDSRGRYLY